MLYVVRHGETDYNVARRICGHAEAQLTEKGYQQAELVAEKNCQTRNSNRPFTGVPFKTGARNST